MTACKKDCEIMNYLFFSKNKMKHVIVFILLQAFFENFDTARVVEW